MARILFAWELGAHFGHLRRDAPVAQKLRDAGHQILFAVRDTKIASAVLTPLALDFVQAPVLMAKPRLKRAPSNYSELLLAEGYGIREVLSGGVKAWLKLFHLYQPDLIVADHSPTALIAARIRELSVVQIGCSFSVPPRDVPMPAFSVQREISRKMLVERENRLVALINSEMAVHGNIGVTHISDLFDTDEALLMCFEELDHYGSRPGARCLGPILTLLGTNSCHWNSSREKRIFAYLHAGVAGTDEMLQELRAVDAEVICVLTGQGREGAVSKRMRIFKDPINLQSLLPDATLVVSNGGGSLCSQALLAGVPMLLVPGHMEQLLQSRCLERIGAGRVIGLDRKRTMIRQELEAMLFSHRYRAGAGEFAEKYSVFDFAAPENMAVARVAEVIESIAIPTYRRMTRVKGSEAIVGI